MTTSSKRAAHWTKTAPVTASSRTNAMMVYMWTLAYLRHFRIAGYAILDITVAFLGVLLLSSTLTKLCRKIGLEIPSSSWLCFSLPLGVLVHLAVGVMTPMTRNTLNLHGAYGIKIVLIVLTILGILEIKRISRAPSARPTAASSNMANNNVS